MHNGWAFHHGVFCFKVVILNTQYEHKLGRINFNITTYFHERTGKPGKVVEFIANKLLTLLSPNKFKT